MLKIILDENLTIGYLGDFWTNYVNYRQCLFMAPDNI